MSRDTAWPWSVLGLERMPADTGDIRRAYARALKAIDQSKDIEGFAALRQAYEQGMAIRENRTKQGQLRKERRAEAAKDVGPDLDAPRSGPVLSPPVPPAIDPRTALVQALLRDIDQENPAISPAARVVAILKLPESSDPEFEPQIRGAIASLMRRKFQTGFHKGILSDDMTAEVLRALDARYGWLSDYAAYRRDFWGDPALQHAMTVRAFGRVPKPVIPIQRSGRGWAWDWIVRHQSGIGLCYMFVLIHLLRLSERSMLSGDEIMIGAVVLLSPFVLIIGTVIKSIGNDILWFIALPSSILRRRARRKPKP
jgi:hypothetical protein